MTPPPVKRVCPMRPLPHEGTAEGGLCCSLLRLVQSDRQIQQLREELGGFSHRCRNLLNGMKMSLYFVRAGPTTAAAVVGRFGALELPGNRGTPRPVAGDLPANRVDAGSRCVAVLGPGPPAALERVVRKRLRHPGDRSSGAGVYR